MNIEKLIKNANDGDKFQEAFCELTSDIDMTNVEKKFEELKIEVNKWYNKNMISLSFTSDYNLFDGNYFCLFCLHEILNDKQKLHDFLKEEGIYVEIGKESYFSFFNILSMLKFNYHHTIGNIDNSFFEIINDVLVDFNFGFIEKIFGKKPNIFFTNNKQNSIQSNLMSIILSQDDFVDTLCVENYLKIYISQSFTECILHELLSKQLSYEEKFKLRSEYLVYTDMDLERELGRSIYRYMVKNQMDKGMNMLSLLMKERENRNN